MRISYNSPVILTLSFVCTIIMLFDNTFGGGRVTQTFFTVYPSFSFTQPLDYLRLFTHALGHANWMHLLSNFTFILLIGPILEEKYGSKPLLTMMVITAFITGVVNVLFFSTALLGASGIVFMLIVLSSVTNIQKGEIPLTFILISLLFLGREVVNSFQTDDIAQFAHIIGGVCGGFFGLAFSKK
ncbi:rhomboid family intramembrane serine protease [bacterium]|nr:rhomboid family intramembrane serine protease [bacterium]